MNHLFQIPQDKIDSVVRSIMRQKAIAFILALIVCILLEMQGNQDFHLMGFKNLTKLESWLIVDLLISLYMLFWANIAQKRFKGYYTSFRILLTDDGIKKYNAVDTAEDEPKAVQFFAWNEIKRITENSAGLKVSTGLTALIPGTRQITIPKQIEQYDRFRSEIKAKHA